MLKNILSLFAWCTPPIRPYICVSVVNQSFLFPAKSDDGPELRKQLATHLPHIRVCTVSLLVFCQDIIPTRVLTDSEIVEICSFLGNKDHKPDLPEICDITQPRFLAKPFEKSELISFKIDACSGDYCDKFEKLNFNISTHEHRVELCSLELYIYYDMSYGVRVEIRQVDCAEPSPPVSVTALVQAPKFTINFPASSVDDDNGSVILLPNSQYDVIMTALSTPHGLDTYTCNSSSISNNDLTLNYATFRHSPVYSRRNCRSNAGYNSYTSCIKTINYKTLTPK